MSDKEEKELTPAPVTAKKNKRLGKIATITPTRIIVDVNGNGEEIKFDSSKHSTVKVGDQIELP